MNIEIKSLGNHFGSDFIEIIQCVKTYHKAVSTAIYSSLKYLKYHEFKMLHNTEIKIGRLLTSESVFKFALEIPFYVILLQN